jgi:hypothetical protein
MRATYPNQNGKNKTDQLASLNSLPLFMVRFTVLYQGQTKKLDIPYITFLADITKGYYVTLNIRDITPTALPQTK